MRFNCITSLAYIATVFMLWYAIMEMLLLLPVSIKVILIIYAFMLLYTPIAVRNLFTWIKNDLWQGSEQ